MAAMTPRAGTIIVCWVYGACLFLQRAERHVERAALHPHLVVPAAVRGGGSERGTAQGRAGLSGVGFGGDACHAMCALRVMPLHCAAALERSCGILVRF